MQLAFIVVIFFQGQFNHRTRNTNLIAVPLISTDTEDTTPVTITTTTTTTTKKTNNFFSNLIRPQDRYCKLNSTVDVKTDEQKSSKFSRYKDKSDSESESDDDVVNEGEKEREEVEEGEKKLERSNSLEALMQELENEIEGRNKTEESVNNTKVKVKVKKVKKKVEEEKLPEKKVVVPPAITTKEKKMVEPKFEKVAVVAPPQPILLPLQPAYVAPPPVQQQPYYQPPPVYCPLPLIHYEPPIRYERIPSPLTIDADLLNTTVTAPLSPRSAAFVLQNREIIERRKQRRSYSRSPSPRYRRSRTKSRSPKTPPSSRRSKVTTTTTAAATTATPPDKKSSVYERLGARIGLCLFVFFCLGISIFINLFIQLKF